MYLNPRIGTGENRVGSKYVEPRAARHRIVIVDGVEQVRIPMRRNWFVLLFLPIWLTGWTAGGIAAISALFIDFHWFLLLWLCGWVFGWVYAALALAGQLWGAETIDASHGDLTIRDRIWPFVKTRRYRASDIRNLQAATKPKEYPGMREFRIAYWTPRKSGAVSFDYGSETVYCATEVDPPEGREIAAWLARRLPARAVVIA